MTSEHEEPLRWITAIFLGYPRRLAFLVTLINRLIGSLFCQRMRLYYFLTDLPFILMFFFLSFQVNILL